MGGSAGMALHAAIQVCRETPPDKNVLVILPDGGRPYLSKVFDDAWMIQHGFLERVGEAPSIAQVLRAKTSDATEVPAFVAVGSRPARVGGDRRCCSSTASRSCRWCGARTATSSTRSTSATWSARSTSATCSTTSSATTTRSNVEVSTLMAPPLSVVRCADAVDAVFGDLQERPAVVVADGVVPGRRADALRPARLPRRARR